MLVKKRLSSFAIALLVSSTASAQVTTSTDFYLHYVPEPGTMAWTQLYDQARQNLDFVNRNLEYLAPGVEEISAAIEQRRAKDPQKNQDELRQLLAETNTSLSQNLEAKQELEKAIRFLQNAGPKCGDKIAQAVERAVPPAVVTASAYKAWVLSNSPGASESVRKLLKTNGLESGVAEALSIRIGKIARSPVVKSLEIFGFATSITISAIDATDGWCNFLADETGKLPVPTPSKHPWIKWVVIPISVGLVCVGFYWLGRRLKLFADEGNAKKDLMSPTCSCYADDVNGEVHSRGCPVHGQH